MFGVKASPVQLNNGISTQEWHGDELSNEPLKPRNASNYRRDTIVVSRVGDQLRGWSGGNAGDCSSEISSKPNLDFGLFQHQFQASNETDTSFQANSGSQLTHGLTGDGFGSVEAHGDPVVQRGQTKEDMK